jgi:E3 ubiquitin-protein ligase TRIP12
LKEILEGLKAEGDDSRQMECLLEFGDFIAVSNEESLGGFPVEAFTQSLVALLHHEHNPDMMLLAARSLTHLIDVLPQHCGILVEAGVWVSLLSSVTFSEHRCLGSAAPVQQASQHRIHRLGRAEHAGA